MGPVQKNQTTSERQRLRESGRVASNCRFIQVKKSRLGREGDCLVVERDVDGVYSVWDHTPTERRMDEGLGDPDPSTIALRIVRDRSRGDAPQEQRQMTCLAVWEQLVEEVTGQGRAAPAMRSVNRWLKRWVEDGVLVLGGILMEGVKKNKRTHTYLTPPIPPSRVGCEKWCPLSSVGSNASGGGDLTEDTGSEVDLSVLSSEPQLTEDTTDSPRERVLSSFPVPAMDLTQLRTEDTISDTDIARTSVSQDETPQEVHPPEDGGRTNGGQGVEVVTGQGREAPTKRSVERWLKRWVEDGVLVLGGAASRGPKGTRTSTYLTPPIPPSRVGCEKGGDLSMGGSNPSEEADLAMDTCSEEGPVVHGSEPYLPMDTHGHPRERVHGSFPVAATDLTHPWTNAPISDTDIGRTSVSQDETLHEVNPPPRGRWPYKWRPRGGG